MTYNDSTSPDLLTGVWNSQASLAITVSQFLQFGCSNEQVALPNCGFALLFNIFITNKMCSQTAKLQRTMLLLLLPRAPSSSVRSAAGCGHSWSCSCDGRQGPLFVSAVLLCADGRRHRLAVSTPRWLLIRRSLSQWEFTHLQQKLCRPQTSHRPSPPLFPQRPSKTQQRQRLEHMDTQPSSLPYWPSIDFPTFLSRTPLTVSPTPKESRHPPMLGVGERKSTYLPNPSRGVCCWNTSLLPKGDTDGKPHWETKLCNLSSSVPSQFSKEIALQLSTWKAHFNRNVHPTHERLSDLNWVNL